MSSFFKNNINTIALITGCIELFLIVHGTAPFSTLEYVMRDQNFFADQTETEKAKTYSRIFTVLSVYNVVHQLIFGFIQDSIGIWWSRCIVHLEMIVGLVILLFTTPERDYLAFIGFPIYYGSGIGLFFSYSALLLLPTKYRAIWSAMIGTAISLGQTLYIGYRVLPEPRVFFVGLLVFQIFAIVRTFTVNPKSNTVEFGIGWETRFDTMEECREKLAKKELAKKERAEQEGITFDPDRDRNPRNPDSRFISTFKEVVTPTLLFIGIFIMYSDLRAYSVSSEFQTWLKWVTDDEDLIATLTDNYIYINLVSTFTNVLVGYVFGVVEAKIREKYNYKQKFSTILTGCIFMGVGVICGILCSVGFMFKTPGVNMYLALIFRVLQVNLYYRVVLVRCAIVSSRNS